MRVGLSVGLNAGLSVGLGEAGRDYPRTAAALTTALGGYGTWSAAWLCDELSGSLQPAFGSPALAAAGAPTYGAAGALGGSDRAMSITQTNSHYNSGATTAIGTGDGVVLLVARQPSAITNGDICGIGPLATGRMVVATSGTDLYCPVRDDASLIIESRVTLPAAPGQWHVIVSALSRTDVALRCAIRSLAGVSSVGVSTALGALAGVGGATVYLGAGAWVGGPSNWDVAYMAIGVGVGVATGIPANIAAICASFSQSIGGL